MDKRNKYYYAQGSDFKDIVNPFPKEYEDKVICGDSLDILKKIPDYSVDLIFTSPPYNFQKDYDNVADDQSWEDYFNKLYAILDECIRVLKYGGRLIINVQPAFAHYIPTHHIINSYLMSQKMIWKGEIIWDKNNHNCRVTMWGSWKSPSNPYLKTTWEFIEVFSKGSLKKEGNKENIDITADEFKQWIMVKWSLTPETQMKKYGHPAMFPERLVERILKLFSYKGDLILDPFGGVGTTAVVAKKLNRHYLSIDISEQYCKTAEERLKEV